MSSLKAVEMKRSMPDYKEICELYKKSFPKVEQFPILLLRLMSHRKGIYSIAFYERNGIFQTNHFFTYDDVTYEILCTDKTFDENDYNRNLESHFQIFRKKPKG